MKMGHNVLAAVAIAVSAQVATAGTTVVTFDNGAEGWSGPGGPGGSTVINPIGGNPGANMHTVFNDFGITFSNTTNPAFVQDLTQYASVTISIDLKANLTEFFFSPVTRPWVLELRDFDQPGPDNPFYSSVFFKFADVGMSGWTTWSVTIDNPQSAALPAGWGGSGDIDGNFEPILPAGVTFESILAGYDEIVFTTLQPGFFFGFTDFDWQIDNISITTVPIPGPGALALLGVSGLMMRGRRRRA
jgi:hypothetical protein